MSRPGTTLLRRGTTAALVTSLSLVMVTSPADAAKPQAPTAASVGANTVETIRHGLATGAFTCTELITAYLQRINAYDKQGPDLNAVITLNPRALEQARTIDEQRARHAAPAPASCIPVVVKDVINTDDLPTTEGSALFDHWTPAENAGVVDDLENAGAIVLAKTNLDDFAAAVYGISSLAGPMHNPYDLQRTVGGSSGGSALAVAAGYAPLAIGTDTGGSLRIPAALTGVVTIRPTLGLVSRSGIFPRALTQDTAGPIAANVEDAAFGLDLIAGYDSSDPVTAAANGKIPAKGYASSARGGRLDGMRIGLVTHGLSIWGDQPGGPVVQLLEKAAGRLEALGATVVPLDPPPSSLLGASSVITYESAHDVNSFLAAQRNPPVSSFQQLYDSGSYTPYAKESYDREIQVDPDTLAQNTGYQAALAARAQFQQWTLDLMAGNRLDAIAYPSAAQTADLIGKEQAGLFTRWSENTGFPAIGVPMGYAQSSTGTDLPASVEFLGRPFDEPTIIRVGSAYENASHLRVAPPLPLIK